MLERQFDPGTPDAVGSAHSHERRRLESWVDDHGDALFRFALTKVDDLHVVEDLLQETYLAALRSFAKFRGDASVRSWLIAILRLKIADHYRRLNRSKEMDRLDEAAAADRPIGEGRIPPWRVARQSPMEREEFWEIFRACLDKLPERLGSAYLMRELDGQSVNQVCDTLEIDPKHLAVRLFRARGLLRDCLNRKWFTQGEG